VKYSENNNDNTKYIYSYYFKNSYTPNTISINIEPKRFVNNTLNPLNYINNKWFINLTNTTIPSTVSNLTATG